MFVSFFFLYLISSFIALWPEKMHYIHLILNLLRLAFWLNMRAVIENVACALEKNVYSAALGKML